MRLCIALRAAPVIRQLPEWRPGRYLLLRIACGWVVYPPANSAFKASIVRHSRRVVQCRCVHQATSDQYGARMLSSRAAESRKSSGAAHNTAGTSTTTSVLRINMPMEL